MNVLVSSCLLGLECRYNGAAVLNESVIKLGDRHHLIPVCPEQLGGMSTPRAPVELKAGRAIDKNGVDQTLQFEKGAEEVVKLAKLFKCTHAVLKSKSPSCGCGLIYDGTFSKQLIKGNGKTVEKLQELGIVVFGEDEVEKIAGLL